MAEIEIVASAPAELELAAVETSALHVQLRDAVGLTERSLERVARIWRELVRRGEDLSGYQMPFAKFLMPVADGRLLAALVVKMSGQPRALERIGDLPIREQQELLNGRRVDVYRGPDRVDSLPLDQLTFSDIALAVRDGRIWKISEQQSIYDRVQGGRKTRSRPPLGRPARIAINPEGNLVVGTTVVQPERVIAVLRQHGFLPRESHEETEQ